MWEVIQAMEMDRIRERETHSETMSKDEILGNSTIYGSHADGRVKPKKQLRIWPRNKEGKWPTTKGETFK